MPRLGYRLRADADILRAEEIRLRLSELGAAAEVFCFSSIDSTNTEARRRAQELTECLKNMIEGAEAAMYQETGDFSKKAELVLGDVWRAKCGVNIMYQDWSMR